MRIVLDTSVLVAALRSQAGASRLLLLAILQSRFQIVISVPLILEYEAVLTRPEHLAATGMSAAGVGELLDELCRIGWHAGVLPNLRPSLSDPNDEMVLETAVGGDAHCLVTFNQADFAGIFERFGIELVTPQQILQPGDFQ